ncbi:MAG: hypothetical protein OXM57_02645, partial [bacterium]|nr:hypothetical protein [bacterium]
MIALVAISLAGCAPTESPTIPDAPGTTSTQPATTEPETPATTVAETTTTQPATAEPEDPASSPEVVEFDFSFAIDADGWVVGFADLPEDYDQ